MKAENQSAEDLQIIAAEYLQAAMISHQLVQNALTKKEINAEDVDVAIGHQRDMAFKLTRLKLALQGVVE